MMSLLFLLLSVVSVVHSAHSDHDDKLPTDRVGSAENVCLCVVSQYVWCVHFCGVKSFEEEIDVHCTSHIDSVQQYIH